MRPHLAPTPHTHNPPRLERRISGGDLPASRGCTASGTMQPHLAPTHTHTHSQPTQAREENVRRRPPCQQEMHSLRHNATPLSSNTHTHNLPRLDSRIHGSDFPASRGCTASGTMQPHLAPTHTHTHTLTAHPG